MGFGGLAQLGERLPCKQEVTGSIPVLSTKEIDWSTKEIGTSLSLLQKKIQTAPWKLNIDDYDAIMRRQHKGKFLIG